MSKKAEPERWQLVQRQATSYRAWAFVCLVLSLTMTVLSIVSGSRTAAQLMLALLAGATLGWILAAICSGRAAVLRRRSDSSRGGS